VDEHGEMERRASERWKSAERIGAFLDVGTTFRVGATEVEIVRTMADCATTGVFYRTSGAERVDAWPVWPIELLGGVSGTFLDDLQVCTFNPVMPHRKRIILSFPRTRGHPAAPIASVPVDRARTLQFDRYLGSPVPPVEGGGIRGEILDARAGVLDSVVELLLEAMDPEILAVILGEPHKAVFPHPQTGPGPQALWREWQPPAEWVIAAESKLREKGLAPLETVGTEVVDFPDPWSLVALPTGNALAESGTESDGYTATTRFDRFRVEAPPPEAEALQLTVRQLYTFRYAGGVPLSIPSPRPEEAVDLRGLGVNWPGGELEFLAWNPAPDGGATLLMSVTPGWWPDLRVLVEDASFSLWMSLGSGGRMRGHYSRLYRSIYERSDSLELALRLVGRLADPLTLTIPLAPPGTGV
jgi:hypothetical protein